MPYRIEDLITVIDDRMGKLENRSRTAIYNKLLQRIKTFRNHPRYGFMFENATVGGDTMAEVVSHLFRIPANGKPMTIMQLAGFPAEVVDSVVSVLSRMAFDFGLWSDGASPLLFVCEEAHRYAPADTNIGFGPTRRALSRIAKEGRKYGVFLGLVTQRPAEIDPNIISQCSTMFVMRLSNDRDQALIRSAMSDAGASMLTFVPSLGTGEVFAFGAGVPLPTRMKFRERAAGAAADQRGRRQHPHRGRRVARPQHDQFRDRPLARRDHEQRRPGGRRRRRARLLARRHRAAPREDVPRYPSAPPLAPAAAPRQSPTPRHLRPPRRRSSPRRSRSGRASCGGRFDEPPGPNNPAPLPSRYR